MEDHRKIKMEGVKKIILWKFLYIFFVFWLVLVDGGFDGGSNLGWFVCC
jgi:hypothetical protein